MPDPNIFLLIAVSVAAAAAVNLNGIKTLLANVLSKFPIKGNPDFGDGPKSVPKNLRDFPILCNWVFDNFIWAEEFFGKTLWNFETCVLVINTLCGNIFSSLKSPTTFEEVFL